MVHMVQCCQAPLRKSNRKRGTTFTQSDAVFDYLHVLLHLNIGMTVVGEALLCFLYYSFFHLVQCFLKRDGVSYPVSLIHDKAEICVRAQPHHLPGRYDPCPYGSHSPHRGKQRLGCCLSWRETLTAFCSVNSTLGKHRALKEGSSDVQKVYEGTMV